MLYDCLLHVLVRFINNTSTTHLYPYLYLYLYLSNQTVGHEGALLDAAFSADGTLAATASEDFTIRVWDMDDDGEGEAEGGGDGDSDGGGGRGTGGALREGKDDEETWLIWQAGGVQTKPKAPAEARRQKALRVLEGHAGWVRPCVCICVRADVCMCVMLVFMSSVVLPVAVTDCMLFDPPVARPPGACSLPPVLVTCMCVPIPPNRSPAWPSSAPAAAWCQHRT